MSSGHAKNERETSSCHGRYCRLPKKIPMTTLIERVQVLESRVNNLEPSNSTLHSSISSTPLEPPEDHRRKEGSTNEPSSSSTPERPTVPITRTYTMGELEGRLLKRIQAIESQLTQYGTQELPIRQRELETKLNRLLQTTDLRLDMIHLLTHYFQLL